MFKYILFVVLLSLLASCGFVEKSAEVTKHAVILSDDIKSNRVREAIYSVPLTPTEITILTRARNDFERSTKVLEDIFKHPELDESMIETILLEFEKFKVSYASVRNIVVANFDRYDAYNQAYLRQEHERAKMALTAMNELIAMKERNRKLVDAGRIIRIVGAMALKAAL